ncbi:MAG: recombination protein RecR [Bdellovibrionaceae bacterium]|jgi:recombination protein RecR|nr:recombination protein RecR [Pseudobdellovibrionaceae bacterium]
MIENMPSFSRLVSEFNRLPGIGYKTATRLAYHILKSPTEIVENMAQSLVDVKEYVGQCTQCFSYTEGSVLCRVCSDDHRDKHVLCVVEDPWDIITMENSGIFRGQYHVLHGVISPLDGISPKDLKIDELMSRVELSRQSEATEIKELIFALDADLEGDTTILYLAKLLKDKGVSVTRIAHGVPVGGDIDYVDHRTLGRALENRVNI